ncbi:hypothetical protein GAY31_20065 [Azospirillum brasilense]|nr:hypothetical protein [Azospirillum brasilense]
MSNIVNMADYVPSAKVSENYKNSIARLTQSLTALESADMDEVTRVQQISKITIEIGRLQTRLSAALAKEAREQQRQTNRPTTEEEEEAWELIRQDVQEWIDENEVYFVAEGNRWLMRSSMGWSYQTTEAVRTANYTKFANQDWYRVLHEVMAEQKRIKKRMTYSAKNVGDDILNMLRYEPLVPIDEEPHWFFDMLIYSISGGKRENIEHIEQLIVSKWRCPHDATLPWLVLNDGGGTGKSLLGQRLLPGLFGAEVVGKNLDVMDICGKFNSQVAGLLVGLINEKPEDNYDHNKLKAVAGSPTVYFEQKGLPRVEGENFFLGIMASNNSGGTVNLAGNDSDRRFSIVAGNKPIEVWISETLGWSRQEAHEWIKNEGQWILESRTECGKWIAALVKRWPTVQSVRALHGADYLELVSAQKTIEQQVFDHIFNDPAFKYVKKPTLRDVYLGNCRYNAQHSKSRNNFYGVLKAWLAANRPDIVERQVKWKDGNRVSSADVYILDTDTRSTLDNNDGIYVDTDSAQRPPYLRV